MLRVVTPLQKLKSEGGITLDAELAAVGRDKSFQCLLMEERAKVKREMACGVLASVWGSPARSGRSASASPSPAPSPSSKAPSPPRGPVYVETGTQAEPETCDSTTMTNESMQMALTRSEIIEKQALEIDNLHAEVAELQKVLGGSPYDVLDYFRPMQQEWLLSQDLMQKEEER